MLSFVGKLTKSEPSTLTTILSAVCIVIAIALTFVKVLDNKLSIILCSTCLAIHLFNVIHTAVCASTKFQAISGPLSDFVLIVIALVFIVAKYEDKKARRTN